MCDHTYWHALVSHDTRITDNTECQAAIMPHGRPGGGHDFGTDAAWIAETDDKGRQGSHARELGLAAATVKRKTY